MQSIDGNLIYSATDLVGFVACEHLTNLERATIAGLVDRPMRPDPELDRLVMRGIEHERKFLETLRSESRTVQEIEPDGSIESRGDRLRESARRTEEAMRLGVDVIYQATLFDTRRRGHADFLIRTDTPSLLGDWSYEVWDTKLARQPKGSALLQLCFYTDLLTNVQGAEPERMHLALGGSQAQTATYRVSDFAAYYRLIVRDFEQFIGRESPRYPPPSRPDPVEHCDVCRWSELCRATRRAADDLSLVAGITARQRRVLRERGVETRQSLAALLLPIQPQLEGTSAESLNRIREQARVQVEGDAVDGVLSERLPLRRLRNGQPEPNRGLLSLPAPSAGDLFFDIEGDPFAMDDGVDYLFGVLEPDLLDEAGHPTFHTFWSIDENGEVTPEAERHAFEAFMDLVVARRAANPDLHIYHYAPYEPTAVKRLMGRYGTREDEVDELLRGGVFVDLYRAVRQGIRASVESYSIKRLEPLYGFERTVDLRDAGSSIVAFETWLEIGSEVEDAAEILERIEGYNRDDCVSTQLLRDWLEAQRDALAEDLSEDLPRPVIESGEPHEELAERLAQVAELAERLTHDVPEDTSLRSDEQQARWLLAQLLHWHRREEKSTWWRYFYLVNDLTDEERIAEPDAIGGLVAEGAVREERRSVIYRFRFPPQDHKIALGSSPHDPATRSATGTVVYLSDEEGMIELSRGRNREPPTPASLVPLDLVSSKELRESLLRLAAWVAEYGVDGPGPYRAGRDLLLRRRPRAGQDADAGLTRLNEDVQDAARRIVLGLQESYLAIQGPPGSGKTTAGAEMIVDLVAAGKRVGVTANSHKVIGQLLERAAAVATRRGQPVAIAQRPGSDGETTFPEARALASTVEARSALVDGEVQVAGGTAWLWSREEMSETVDVLFVDEAGQMSLANVLAVASCARNLVLLGDPQQLDQPLQGVHPPGADRSALAHLLGSHPTMPDELGLFLSGTWRLHPEICSFTSEVFYEGRLSSHPGRDHQEVAGTAAISGAGLRFLGVDHTGHASESPEEAIEIAKVAADLLGAGASWTDERGVEQPLRLEDILVITPYNAQVREIAAALPGIRVGTVDKFQGQEGPISIYSMATSSPEEAPRGMEFLYSLNRLNVATSRARCLAVIVASPDLVRVRCRTPRQMQLANALARFLELAR